MNAELLLLESGKVLSISIAYKSESRVCCSTHSIQSERREPSEGLEMLMDSLSSILRCFIRILDMFGVYVIRRSQ